MYTAFSFKGIENKHDVYRGKDCMKIFCEPLIEHTIKMIKFKKKKNEVINKQTAGIIWKCKKCYICKEKFEDKYVKDENMRTSIAKLRTLSLCR